MFIFSFPYLPLPAPPFDEASQSSKEPHTSAAMDRQPKPQPITRGKSTSTQDAKSAFNLHHRMRRPGGNVAPMILLAPSTDLLAAEEGRVCEEVGQVEKGEAGRMEMEDARLGEDKRTTDSMQGMAHQPTGFPPPQYVYYPMHHPWRMHYDQDPYVAQYRAARAFPDHPSSFVPDPWEDRHADYENQMQYMRGGGQYGPQDPSNRFPAYQGPYPPLRDHLNDAVPGYYYHRTCAQPPPQSLQSPVLHGSTHSNLTPGMSPWPPQQQTYLPPAQSTVPLNRDTPPKSKFLSLTLNY
ncbi:hypothetical protein PISMIDRAFT_10934 [Pisolithus microcarpus 441]|uniref:Uncharacterized protein n=1 Tax=Pisolithus microcarpus 441 TaxID=765257 RepID=A0A0C9Z354_9AGAM|nr:hypothetical protein PISMIDRAFT_10934 [Pisolithus microcarpus 441]